MGEARMRVHIERRKLAADFETSRSTYFCQDCHRCRSDGAGALIKDFRD